jgi:hypothetical protein
MNISEAIGILKPKENTRPALKTAYQVASKKYHPDINPGGLDMMKLINLAYELLSSKMGLWFVEDGENGISIDEAIQAIFDKIKHLDGLEFEICGTWLWVSGNTYKHKAYIKSAGFKWSKNKSQWYWHNGTYKKKNKKILAMDDIRNLFGSVRLTSEPLTALG